MSHLLFTSRTALRSTVRTLPRQFRASAQASYHNSAPKKMPPNAQSLRALIRQTTLRASATTVQHSSVLAPTQPQFHHQFHSQRPRSPSPPPPYTSRGITARAPTGHWTHFSTPTSLSSIRTFTSSPKIAWPSASPSPSPSSSAPPSPTSTSSSTSSPSSAQLPSDLHAHLTSTLTTLQDLYATAKDEFDIASEETANNTTYAADDREAAREELDNLLEFFASVTETNGQVDKRIAEEVKMRVGGKVRELEAAVKAMEDGVAMGDHH